MRRVFVCFLEEIEATKKTFRNYLTYQRANKSQHEGFGLYHGLGLNHGLSGLYILYTTAVGKYSVTI